jgi:exo-1,4-beta-D-glucosaminidase
LTNIETLRKTLHAGGKPANDLAVAASSWSKLFLPGEQMPKFLICGIVLCASALGLSAQSTSASGPPRSFELAKNWKLVSARDVSAGGQTISLPNYETATWHPVARMPATVLEILEEDGIYPNLYKGMNLLKDVPQDLYLQDWWYRTTFVAPAGQQAYQLEFPGINYRAEIWLNGNLLADNQYVVGMYVAHQFDVTRWIKPGASNVLAVKVTPERLIQGVNGVELADSWLDWINWKYLGYRVPQNPRFHPVSFVPDRNAGIWKPVYLRMSGAVTVSYAMVNTELPLPQLTSARLTVFAELRNVSDHPVNGVLRGTISRPGKPVIQIEKPLSLAAGEDREAGFTPQQYSQLVVQNPDLWWPYTMGKPNLYKLDLEFLANGQISNAMHIRFGIRTITQHRDQDEQFPGVGKGGSFYLQVNGKDFLARGADYTPDLLYRYDADRDATVIRYVKDMGLNMLRWESKIASDHMVELADEEGVPVMFGWMCCSQWEQWDQWNAEDHRLAGESLASQILMLRSHASVFIWANGSDGLPPSPVLDTYHRILTNLHWQNAVVDTVSSFKKNANGEREWSGVHMEGPYSWRPPTYWFSGRYAATRGACAEQGDNEHIPPYESLEKFIPADKLWPINEAWYFHAGANEGNNTLANIQRAIDRRYGPSTSAQEFARKAQLAHYENTRAQFEDFAANGWTDHKMTLYWMLNSPWPSFFGHLFDYYLKPGGAYYGAKKGLRPLSVVFDSYATGDHSQANFTVVNQTPEEHDGLSVRVRIYQLDGKLRDDRSVNGIRVASGGAAHVLTLPRLNDLTSVYFVRCQLFDGSGKPLTENVYWQSTKDDDLGDPENDKAFDLKMASWADMTALNTMQQVPLEVRATLTIVDGENHVTIRLRNPSGHIAFFERAEITSTRVGNEILPIKYDDNYVTVFPGEVVEIQGEVRQLVGKAAWIKLAGYNTAEETAPIQSTR